MPMKTVSKEITQLLEDVTYITELPCPSCGGEMRAFKENNRDGTAKCPPVCYHKTTDKFGRTDWVGCGYRSNQITDCKTTEDMVSGSIKARALQTFRNGSYFPSKNAKGYNMDSFKVDTLNTSNEQLEAKNTMVFKINKMLDGEINHFMLVGSTGVGKTHLGIASVREFIERSDYEKKGMVVKWGSLLADVKKSFDVGNSKLASDINNKVKDYKVCDLLLIDDLGTELGRIDDNTTAKSYNIELLEEILNARENKNLIVTTNLDSRQIKEAYGERVFSRIMSHMTRENILKFTDTKDMRIIL